MTMNRMASKLANSVRQAKDQRASNQSEELAKTTSEAIAKEQSGPVSEPRPTAPEEASRERPSRRDAAAVESPLPPLSSTRVWPD